EKPGARVFATNGGQAERYHDLARVAADSPGARTLVSIFHSRPFAMPVQVSLMERHPVSSQAFIPINGGRFAVIVGAAGQPPSAKSFCGFVTNGRQGVNYHPGTWHHPLIALEEGDYLVIDHAGAGPSFDQDYEEVLFAPGELTLQF
ncbi:MAG TPA: ureidoglycolate lyase, partial [Aestuariivirga sp.]|nr:ureidoglycolate lyase [Aestuariivirga sp.]